MSFEAMVWALWGLLRPLPISILTKGDYCLVTANLMETVIPNPDRVRNLSSQA